MNVARLLVAPLLTLFFTAGALAQEKTPNLDKREKRQEKRIEQGVKSGELNKRETARLEARESKLRADEAKAKADGKVTTKERAKLQHEANKTSRHNYGQKHDKQKK